MHDTKIECDHVRLRKSDFSVSEEEISLARIRALALWPFLTTLAL